MSGVAQSANTIESRPVTAEFWVAQTFNGISYGALLFLLGSGLSLIFGVMRIVNLSHGSYFMLGGYVGLSVVWKTASFALALVTGAVAVALIGMGMERFLLRRLKGQTLGQVLMTIGFARIFQDLALLI
jgi:branched-chain amino acid transport system permease protein